MQKDQEKFREWPPKSTVKIFFSIRTELVDLAESIDHNAVHGSDSADNAKHEIAFFFKPEEIFAYVPESELA